MKESQTMWEPEWDLTSTIEPPFEGSIPLSLADENCQISLANTYRYFVQICLPADFTDNNHKTWKAIADTLGTTFTPGLSFWDAIGITEHQKQKELASWFRQPYFGDIDTTTWQTLR